MSALRRFCLVLAASAVLLAGSPTVAGALPLAGDRPPGPVSTIGVLDHDGRPVLAELYLLVPPGADPHDVAARAKRANGIRDVTEADLEAFGFSLDPGLPFSQFTDRSRKNDHVVQHYNPAGDPTGGAGLQALLDTHATWNAVRTSNFEFRFGGLTDRPFDVFDGFNDVAWEPLDEGSTLGLTITVWTEAAIVEADVLLNTALAPESSWATDGGDVDVESVLLHENGHVLGLGHSDDNDAVMYPFYTGVRRQPAPDDIAGVSTLYPFASYLRETDPRRASSPFRVAAETDWAFEAGDLNDRGGASYSRYVDEGESLYVTRMGERTELARSGRPAPGGGTYGPGVLGRVDLDSAGNATFAFVLDPLAFPLGRNAGVFRYDRAQGRTDAVVLPGVTQAPGGTGAFSGAARAVGNDRGDVAFGGIVETELGALGSPFGSGVYLTPAGGGPVRAIAAPGDPAPGGGVFDFAANPSINGRGDVAFEGNRSTEPCLTDISPAAVLVCRSGVYLRSAQTGQVRRLAGQNDQVPGGTLLAAYGPMVNGKGDVVFAGDLWPAAELGTHVGIFLATPGGGIVPVVRPGDPMPGGGRVVSAGTGPPAFSVNDAGDVAFVVTLDTHEGDGLGADMGVYLWSQGQVRLVARTGTVAPGIGTVTSLTTPALEGLGLAAAIVNNRGEVLFQATLHDHRVVLVVATGGAVDPCVDALDPEGEHLDGNGSLVFTEDDVLFQARFRGSLCRKAPADRFFAPLLSQLDEEEPQYVGATLRFDPAMGDADLTLLACEGDALLCTTPLVPDEVSAGPGARSLRWTNTTGAAQVVAVDVALAAGGDPALPYVLELFVNLPQPVFPPPGPPPVPSG